MEEEKAKHIPLNSRCEVKVTGQPTKRGTVKYIGEWLYVIFIVI